MSIDWDGPSRQPCPDCDRGPKDRSCGVTVEADGAGVAHCFRCGYVETCRGGDTRHRPGTRPERPPTPTRHEALSEFGHELWAACRPIGGDALAYLRARSCVIPPADGHLRYHPALKHPASSQIGPALVALVTDAASGKPLTLHRTWVSADGNKAPYDPPRMLLGGHRKAGGVVRLWPDEAVTMGLGIAEGIETALSLAHAFTPVWACIDAGNMPPSLMNRVRKLEAAQARATAAPEVIGTVIRAGTSEADALAQYEAACATGTHCIYVANLARLAAFQTMKGARHGSD